ncbi:MAG TPA: PsbP-related protein [Nitrososphaeraceae archaeon]|nr:PsbP-related protein [Nitrososphaeraceae archaeon]
MKLIKTKEIVITPLLFGIIFSVLISSSINNNQQVIAQQQQQQQSPEEIQNEILRGNLDIEEGDGTTTTTTTTAESSVQFLSNGSVLVYESPGYGIRTQYPDGWEIIIQSTSPSSISLRFNSPPENDTDVFRENVVFEINTISNNTALSNFTSAALASYLEAYSDFELIDLSSTNLTSAAIPAYKFVASRTQDGLDFMQIFAIKEDKVYTILYSAERTRYSTFLPIVEEMIDSLEVTYSLYV